MNRFKIKYQQEIVPILKKELGQEMEFALPQIKKVVINMGISNPEDPKQRLKVIENVKEQFKAITGQSPQVTLAKKAIAGFKLRTGDPLGVMVTLRGQYMWEFIDKLINITLPRVKDFRGVSKTAFDGQGNYNLGLEEQIVFPEVDYDQIESIRGLQVTFVTTAQSNEQAFRLLELLGMPFEKEEGSR